MNRGIEIDLDRPRYLHDALIRAVDARLVEAVRQVEEGESSKATVTIALTVEMDEKEGLVGSFTIQSREASKGNWQPSGMGQMRLLEEE